MITITKYLEESMFSRAMSRGAGTAAAAVGTHVLLKDLGLPSVKAPVKTALLVGGAASLLSALNELMDKRKEARKKGDEAEVRRIQREIEQKKEQITKIKQKNKQKFKKKKKKKPYVNPSKSPGYSTQK